MTRKLLLALLALPVVLILGAVLYLKLADLSGWRDVVADAVSEAIGLQLTVSGRFDLEVGSISRVVAEDVTLANPAWSTAPALVHADRVEVDLSLWSLVSGPFRIHDAEVRGAWLLVEQDAEGRDNWTFAGPEEAEPGAAEPEEAESEETVGFALEGLEVNDLHFVYRDPGREEALELRVERLRGDLEASGLYDVSAEGSVGGAPVDLRGSIGPIEGLFTAGRVEHQLSGHFGDIEIFLSGTIADLATLAGPELEVEIDGPDVETVTTTLSLPSLGSGPFRISGALSPVETGGSLDLRLSATVGEVRLEAEGRLGSLLDPGELDFRLDAEAPDLAAVGSIVGVEGLPAGALAVSGRLRRDESGVAFEQVVGRLGDHSVWLDGVLGSSPESTSSEVDFGARGPDLSVFSAVAGLALPPERYEARGNLVRREGGVAVDDVELRVGEARLRLDGTVGSLPSFAGAEIDFHLESPRPVELGPLAGMGIPSRPVEIDGHLVYREGAMLFDPVVVSGAGSTVRLVGTLTPTKSLAGTDLEVHAAGPDLAAVASLIPVELPELPAEPYELAGRVRVLGDGYGLDGLEGSVGENLLEVQGRLGAVPDLVGTELSVELAGPDLSRAGSLVGIAELPAEPYRLAARLRVVGEGYELEELTASAGEITAEVSGHVGPLPALDGSEVALRVHGPRLSDLGSYHELPPLPRDPFTLIGRVRKEGREGRPEAIYHLEEVVAEASGNRLTLSGALGLSIAKAGNGSSGSPEVPSPEVPGTSPPETAGTLGSGDSGDPADLDLSGTDLSLQFEGPDIAATARLLSQAGVEGLPELPPEPYALSGRIQVDDPGARLSDVALAIGGIEVHADALMPSLSEIAEADLTLDASGPDASVIGTMAGFRLPARRFRLRGRVELSETRTRFHGLRVELGDYRAEVDGSLGKWPKLIGTRLDLRATGPDSAFLAELFERGQWTPDQPFEVSGHFEGNPERFQVEGLRARLGPSDLSGSIQIDLRDTPEVQARLRSERLDLVTLLGIGDAAAAAEDGGGPGDGEADLQDESDAGVAEHLFADDPLELGMLEEINGDIRHTIGEITTVSAPFRNVELRLHLQDGRLQLDRVSLEGPDDSSLEIALTLEPQSEGYSVYARLEAEGLRLAAIAPGREATHAVPVALDFEFNGLGDSPRAIASGADGYFIATLGKGRVDFSSQGLLMDKLPGGSFLIRLFDTLNPAVELKSHTTLKCAVVVAVIEDGVVEVDPTVARSYDLRVSGRGWIDLETEELDFQWATKPRRLTTSLVSVTDNFVKLGGTLTEPEIQAKPLEAMTATGVGVATAGASLVALSLWKSAKTWRLCRKARKVARKEHKARQLRHPG